MSDTRSICSPAKQTERSTSASPTTFCCGSNSTRLALFLGSRGNTVFVGLSGSNGIRTFTRPLPARSNSRAGTARGNSSSSKPAIPNGSSLMQRHKDPGVIPGGAQRREGDPVTRSALDPLPSLRSPGMTLRPMDENTAS
jgi:hypothetical protein